MIDKIRGMLSEKSQWEQLAEEAIELAHACMKVVRTLNPENPARTTYCHAVENVHEELADVKLLLKMLRLDGEAEQTVHEFVMNDKVHRWVNHLEAERRMRNGPA